MEGGKRPCAGSATANKLVTTRTTAGRAATVNSTTALLRCVHTLVTTQSQSGSNLSLLEGLYRHLVLNRKEDMTGK